MTIIPGYNIQMNAFCNIYWFVEISIDRFSKVKTLKTHEWSDTSSWCRLEAEIQQ